MKEGAFARCHGRVLVACAAVSGVAMAGCDSFPVRWRVAHPEEVRLERVLDGSTAEQAARGSPNAIELLPAQAGAKVREEGDVAYDRREDGAIDVEFEGKTWRLLEPDGTTTLLSTGSTTLPASGDALAFPDLWRSGLWSRTLRARLGPIRLVTPPANVVDARILVRRSGVLGAVFLGALAAPLGAVGGAETYVSVRDHFTPGIAFGGALLTASVTTAAFGLFYLLRPEHDIVLLSSK